MPSIRNIINRPKFNIDHPEFVVGIDFGLYGELNSSVRD